jgi:hypothetical protein
MVHKGQRSRRRDSSVQYVGIPALQGREEVTVLRV